MKIYQVTYCPGQTESESAFFRDRRSAEREVAKINRDDPDEEWKEPPTIYVLEFTPTKGGFIEALGESLRNMWR